MLPPAHIAYTWLALDLAQKYLDMTEDVDYRLVALAAVGPDLIDKPLAWAYFYKRYKAAVLFAHTLIAHLAVIVLTVFRLPQMTIYTAAFVGHMALDRIWMFPNTFYWPFRGWRFHVWGKRGSEQEKIGLAYWFAFTRRPELWVWEVGGLIALAIFAWRHRLHKPANLLQFILTGRPQR